MSVGQLGLDLHVVSPGLPCRLAISCHRFVTSGLALLKYFFLQGFRNSRIDYNEDLGAWVLYARDKWAGEDVNGTAIASIASVGTGTAIWQFNRDLCNLNTNPPHTLKMTVCSNDQFTCARVRYSWMKSLPFYNSNF